MRAIAACYLTAFFLMIGTCIAVWRVSDWFSLLAFVAIGLALVGAYLEDRQDW